MAGRKIALAALLLALFLAPLFAVNLPPALPKNAPAIESYEPVLYPDGKVKCTNCPIAPGTDPDVPPTQTRTEYRWSWGTQSGQWSSAAGDLDCASAGCQKNQLVQMRARTCDSGSPPACSGTLESNYIAVEGAAPAPMPYVPPVTICQTTEFTYVTMLSGLACLSMAAVIALAYMGGEALHNPRMLSWAKAEALQIFASLAVVCVVLFVLGMLCYMQVGELAGLTGVQGPLVYKGQNGQYTLFEGAILYLEYLGTTSLAHISAVRYAMGAAEVRTTYTEYECDAICLYSMASSTVAKYSGESVNLAILNNMLSTATVAQLGILFQYFILLYIAKGLFALFLPLAIIIRSVPFMRQFGGALIAIFISLYILYPAMIVANAYMAPSLAKGLYPYYPEIELRSQGGPPSSCATVQAAFSESPGSASSIYLSCVDASPKEPDIRSWGISNSRMEDIKPKVSLSSTVKAGALIFIAAIFFPALNFIVIAALARELSRLLGEEADISRLGQMI